MMKSKRFKYWILPIGWILVIYSTLYIVRPICEFLREHIPFNMFINVLMVGSFLSILFLLFKTRTIKKISTYFLLLAVSVLLGYFLITIKIAEEKIHFLEYGFLSFLTFRAINLDVKSKFSYLFTFFLVSTLGWIDEIIQHFLPNRYFDLRDIIFNIIGGAIGILIVFILQREQKRSKEKKA